MILFCPALILKYVFFILFFCTLIFGVYIYLQHFERKWYFYSCIKWIKSDIKDICIVNKLFVLKNDVLLNFSIKESWKKSITVSTKIWSCSTVFIIYNNTCFLSIKSAYYNDFWRIMLNTGVMKLKIQLYITGINNILIYIHMESIISVTLYFTLSLLHVTCTYYHVVISSNTKPFKNIKKLYRPQHF